MSTCHSCMAFEAFTQPPPQKRSCQSASAEQGCVYTAQGDIVCAKGAKDPFFTAPQPTKTTKENFMMRVAAHPGN